MMFYTRWHRGHYYHRPEFDRLRQLWEGGFSSDTERDHFYESARQVVQSRLEVRGRDPLVVGVLIPTLLAVWCCYSSMGGRSRCAQVCGAQSITRRPYSGVCQFSPVCVEMLTFLRVEQRLRDEGWGKDLDWHDGAALGIIKAMKSVCRPHKLTDRGADTSVQFRRHTCPTYTTQHGARFGRTPRKSSRSIATTGCVKSASTNCSHGLPCCLASLHYGSKLMTPRGLRRLTGTPALRISH